MCYPRQCEKCGKTTWGGCGMHAEFVMARVAPDQRCMCRGGGAAASAPAPAPAPKPARPVQPASSSIISGLVRPPSVASKTTAGARSKPESLGQRLFGSESSSASTSSPQTDSKLPPTGMPKKFDYDLIVIGGGSGGLAGAKAAAKYGKKVCCLDFVKPSPQGSTWGLGGTCVNVGCIPKRLMHQAGLLGEMRHDLHAFGWLCNLEGAKMVHDWDILRNEVDKHIKSLNFNSKAELLDNNVHYINGLGKLVAPYTIEVTKAKGEKTNITAQNILLAVGGRPQYPTDVPGAMKYGVSSDDLFKLPRDPGKTCVVGASYVALECAGFLTSLGKDVTVLIRSVPLRGFDQEMAKIVVDNMATIGTHILRGYVPVEVKENAPGAKHKYAVTIANINDDTDQSEEQFDTVMFATGRKSDTSMLGLNSVGVKVDEQGKVICNALEQTSVPYIYAVGDIVKHGLELTPVAIRAARLLMDRLYGGKDTAMDYISVPTTVFTPLEYGCVGLSEENAIEKYGESDIEVYHSSMKPLEWTLPNRSQDCFVKLITVKSQRERVVGFHIASPVAAEITQAVAVAIRCGAKKSDFDSTIGIHPSIAEEITQLTVTKASGATKAKVGC